MKVQPQRLDLIGDFCLVAEENGLGDAVHHCLVGRADDLGVLAFAVNDALGILAGLEFEQAHHLRALTEAGGQLVHVRVQVNLTARHTRFHGGFRYRRCYPHQNARVQAAWG